MKCILSSLALLSLVGLANACPLGVGLAGGSCGLAGTRYSAPVQQTFSVPQPPINVTETTRTYSVPQPPLTNTLSVDPCPQSFQGQAGGYYNQGLSAPFSNNGCNDPGLQGRYSYGNGLRFDPRFTNSYGYASGFHNGGFNHSRFSLPRSAHLGAFVGGGGRFHQTIRVHGFVH